MSPEHNERRRAQRGRSDEEVNLESVYQANKVSNQNTEVQFSVKEIKKN